MPLLGSQIDHLFSVIDMNGSLVTGLTGANFTTTLQRWNGSALVADADAVTITEVDASGDPGRYRASYTPQTETGLHLLTVLELATIPNSLERTHEFQDIVFDTGGGGSGVGGQTGPYLTTRERFRTAMDIKGPDSAGSNDPDYDQPGDLDELIDLLLPAVTALFQGYTQQGIVQEVTTTITNGRGRPCLVLPKQPVQAVLNVWESVSIPRVYGADELLTEGSDYLLDENGILHRLAGRWPAVVSTVKVQYISGYETIPADIERAAMEVMQVKLDKGKDHLYHRKSESAGEGQAVFLDTSDLTPSAMKALAPYVRTF